MTKWPAILGVLGIATIAIGKLWEPKLLTPRIIYLHTILAALFISSGAAIALDGPISHNSPFGSCTINYYSNSSNSEAYVYLNGKYAGGSYYNNLAGVGPAIDTNTVAACLGVTSASITGFASNGADSTYSADNYIGVSFTSGAQFYEFALSGASSTSATTAVVPGTPGIGPVTPEDSKATINFSGPSSNGGSPITSYTVTSSPGGFSNSSTNSPIAVTGLSNGTAYTFTVTATNAVGTSSPSASSSAVTPKGSQTVTFPNPGSQSLGTSPTLSATASSGLSPTFSSSTTSVCTISTGGTLTLLMTGTCTITADQSGDSTTAAAPPVNQSFAVIDTTPPTVIVSALSGPTSGVYTSAITLSEPSTDFVLGDLTLTNATAVLTGSGTSYTATLTPTADGTVALNVAASVFTDAAGNGNLAGTEVSAIYDGTAPTVTVSALSGPTSGVYTSAITLSEPSTDFVLGDLTLTNATAVLTGSGTSYTATLTPTADGTVALNVAASVFTDAAGNGNLAGTEVSTIYDGTRPSVEITNAPLSAEPGTSFPITITFSEPVTGFVTTDISIKNATVTALTGTGAVYAATLNTGGTGNIEISVPANVAFDVASNGNLISNVVNISNATVAHTQKIIASYMQSRANHLTRSQPNLTSFLSGAPRRPLSFNATNNSGNFSFASGPHYPIWFHTEGAWAVDESSKSQYVFGAFGSHWTINESLLLGAMIQVDHLNEDTELASVSGTGWLVGPYFVVKSTHQPLFLEGRLLYGRSNNAISPYGTYEDSFNTTRLLAQIKVAGELNYKALTLTPFLDASYTTDDQDSYVDDLGNIIPEQGIELGQIEIGMDFSKMFPVSTGEAELHGGISGIWSHSSVSGFASTVTPNYEGGRARIELGLKRTLSSNQQIGVSTYYDGIGANGFESYGVNLGYKLQF